MKARTLNTLVCGCLAVACLLTLYWWLSREVAPDVAVGLPGMDDPEGRRKAFEKMRAVRTIDFGGIYETFAARPADATGSWPRFRGADIDGIVKDDIRLADSFGDLGPRHCWSIELAPGYAGAAVHKGRVFVLDYMEGQGDALRCFTLDGGQEMWRVGYAIRIVSNHGISRTVPAVTDRYTVTLGPMGHVMCVDTDTGKCRWGLDLMRDYGTRDLSKCWYAGQCPLVDDGRAIIAPVGTNVLMMAVDCETGETVWETPHTQGWKMSHSSIVPMTVAGTRTYVYAAVGGVVGVAADDSRAGRILWQTDKWSASVVIPSPVPLDGSRIFLTSGYGGGCALLEITREGDEFEVEVLYTYSGREASRRCFSCYQHTPISFGGHLFGIQSNDAQEHAMEFLCVDPEQPGGKIVWASGKQAVFTAPKKKEAWGPYILADNKFYVIGDTGLLAVFRAATDGCSMLGQWQLMSGHEVWGPLAVAGGRLLVRDAYRLVCFDIRAGQ